MRISRCTAVLLASTIFATLALPFAPAETASPLAEALQPFVDKNTLAGAVMLVANRNRVLAVETVGYADLASHKPLGKDDLFWIASMSKPKTATAFMMIVDEGKEKLEDHEEK